MTNRTTHPTPHAPALDAPARATHRDRISALVVCALVALGPVAACSSEGDDASADGELFPERTGDPMAVASGGEDGAQWELSAQESVEGSCLLVEDELDRQTEACGFDVPALHDIGFFDHTGVAGSPQVFAGVAADEVADVRLDIEGGTSISAPLLRPDGATRVAFFVVELTEGQRVSAVVALGADGQELERRAT